MSGRPAYPAVDPRRATALREALLRDIAALAPDWKGVAEAAGHDRALVEIAARLMEQATRRLDGTAERDALAFLDLFDIPAPQPRAAEGHIVVALADGRPGPQVMPVPTALEIGTEAGEPAGFETKETLTVHAGRIAVLATVDPAADAIGLAPSQVTALGTEEVPDIAYRLDAAAGPDDRVIRLSFATGISPGDLLRFEDRETGDVRMRVVSEAAEDGLVTLAEPLGGAGVAVGREEIRRMTWLDAFAMPDLQEHALYIGDTAAFDTTQPAEIYLDFAPSGAAAQLMAEPVIAEIWGQREEPVADEEPRWHRLPPLGVNGDRVGFLKPWTGPVIEREIHEGLGGRWIRIRRTAPILPNGSTPLTVDRIERVVELPPPQEAAGTVGVTQAAHNATPLPVTSSFLPFGAQPNRFDTFALAAPEVFSKSGARARLDVQLLDATLETLVASVRADTGRHGYGIGTNGRLQIIDFEADPQFWREAPGPEPEPGSTLEPKLDPGVGPWAAEIGGDNLRDWVVAGVRTGEGPASLYAARIILDPGAAEGDLALSPWRELPPLPEEADPSTTRALAMTPVRNLFVNNTNSLVFVGQSGVYRLFFRSTGDLYTADWERFALPPTGPELDASAVLFPVPGSFDGPNGLCLVTDRTGALWALAFVNSIPVWTRLEDGAGNPLLPRPGSVPTGLVWGGSARLSVAWVSAAAGVSEAQFATFDLTGGAPAHLAEGAWPVSGPPEEVRLALVSGVAGPQAIVAPGPGPVIVALGRNGRAPAVRLIVTDDPSPGAVAPIAWLDQPTAAEPWAADGLGPFLAFSGGGAAPARLWFAGRNESLISLPLARIAFARFLSWAETGLPATEHAALRVSYRTTGSVDPERLGEVAGAAVEMASGQFVIPLPLAPGEAIDQTAAIRVMRFVSRPETRAFYGGGNPAFGVLIYPEESTVTPAPAVGDVIYLSEGADPLKVARFVVDDFDDTGDTGRITVDGAALDAFADGSPGPVRWRIASEVTYVSETPPNGRLIFTASPSLPTPDMGDILVLTEPGTPGRVGLLTVESAAADEIVVAERDELDAFMAASAGPVDWRLAEVVDPADAVEIPPGSAEHYGTFVRLVGVDPGVDRIGVPDPINPPFVARAGFEPTVALGNVAQIVVPAWERPLPPDGWVTAMAPGEPAQAFATEPLDRAFAAPELSWEYFNGKGWARLDEGFEDFTLNFARSGEIRFHIPTDLSPFEVGGQEDLWIRARLVGGDYGRPRYVVTSVAGPGGSPVTQSVDIDTSHMRPPEIGSIGASFDRMPPAPPAAVVARNNRRDIVQTSANATQGAFWPPFEGTFQGPLGTPGNAPALYLGLTEPLPPDLVTLYVSAEDRAADQDIRLETLGADLGWSEAPLISKDPTHGLHQSGLIRFTVAAPMVPQNLFGEVRHWLRIVGGAGWEPRLRGMWLNGVEVLQAETIEQELLGTTLGEKFTTFRLLRTPVLEGSLELRVRERLGDEEIAELRKAAGGGPDPVLEDVPNIPGTWVLWRPVTGLEGAGSERVYRLAPDGTVTFGDGRAGRIPPAGRDAVRAFSYRTGGERVAVAGFTDAKPRLQVPGFDAAFVPESFAGGTEAPGPSTLIRRMPEALRHQSAGLSLADLEALARDSDSEIVQVRARAPSSPDGPVELSVLARGAGRMPVYGRARREALAAALTARMSDAWGNDCLDVRSVRFVAVTVSVTLLAEAGRAADANAAARAALWRFFDPARGGPGAVGWPPGRRPWPLDVERCLAGAPGILSVTAVKIARADGTDLGPLAPDEVVVLRAPEDQHVSIREAVRS